MISLAEALVHAGLRIEPAEFLELVEDAARQLGPRTTDPPAHLSNAQALVLREVGADLTPLRPGEPDSRAQSAAELAAFMGTALSVRQTAEQLGVSTSRVRHRLADGQLAGVHHRSGWRLPAWQFTEQGVLPGLDVVLAALPADEPPPAVAAFMLTPDPDLEIVGKAVSPRAWLAADGDPTAVAALARALAAFV